MGATSLKSKTNLIDYLLGSIGLLTIILVTMGVISRFVLQVSIAWSDEVLRTVFVWAYFIGTAMKFKDFSLMRLELLDGYLQKKEKKTLGKSIMILQNVVIVLFSSVVLYNGLTLVLNQIITKQVTTTSRAPAWILPLGFVIGISILLLLAIRKIFKLAME